MKLFLYTIVFFLSLQASMLAEDLSYKDALKSAQETDKKMLVYFGADWCHYCQKMQSIIEDKEVAKKLDKYLIVKLSADVELDLKKEFSVSSIPAFMVVDKNQNVLKKHSGYKNKSSFLSWLKD